MFGVVAMAGRCMWQPNLGGWCLEFVVRACAFGVCKKGCVIWERANIVPRCPILLKRGMKLIILKLEVCFRYLDESSCMFFIFFINDLF